MSQIITLQQQSVSPLTEAELHRLNTPEGLRELMRAGNADARTALMQMHYADELRGLHVELVKMQRWVQKTSRRIAIIFEGRDASGKGGAIRRFTQHLNPRSMRVVALPKPTEEERGQ